MTTALTRHFARAAQRRRDRRTLLVLWAVDASQPATGYGVMRITGLSSGALYPVLVRCEADGLVTSDWSHPQPLPDGKPRRRYYQVTDAGRDHIRALATRLDESR